jgi:pyruvate,orthophosphate dikinase
MSKHVFSFGNGTSDGDGKMKDVLGGKGAGLAEMSRAGLPVPPGFTIATDVCNIYFKNNKQVPDDVEKEIEKALEKLEKQMGQKLGDPSNPLLLSVRSGAKFSMPGMMNTILNLGLNDTTAEGLAAKSGNARFAYDCYRRFIQMFGEVALEIEMEEFNHIFDARKAKARTKLDTDLSGDDLKAVIVDYKKLVQKKTGKPFPEDPRDQLKLARNAVFGSWWNDKAAYYRKMEKIPDDIGTAANVQAMVFGNMGETSATGVGFTRDPATGEKVFYGEFLINAQGEDGRYPHDAADFCARSRDARSVRRAEGNHDESREALQRHAGLRVHRSGQEALHAANAQRQEDWSGRGSRRRRHGA